MALSTTFRGHFRTLLWVCLAALALGGPGAEKARALDAVGLEVAADEVRVALDDMAAALNGAPRDVQLAISADLHLMSQAITRVLGRLENGGVPIVDPTLVYDLNLLADIVAAATGELQAAAADGTVAPESAERIDALADAATARLIEVDLVIEGWSERARNAVVEIAEVDGAVVVRTTDRLIYNGVRYTSIGLLLVGLLVVGLQLLRMSEDRVDSLALLRETPLLSSLAVIVLVGFFAGCVVFSLKPGMLATLSAEIRQQPQEHPCERLAEQRDRLVAAQQVAHRQLVEATKERMIPAAQDCLGLPSETSTAEALDLLAAKTDVAYREPPRPQPPGIAVAAAEREESVSDADGLATPELTALDEPAETEELDDLADLAAQLDEAQTSLSERLDDVLAAELGRADEEPAPGPEPAAGPAAPAAATETAAAAAPSPEPNPPAPATRPAVAPATEEAPDEVEPELYITTATLNYRAGPSLNARRLGTLIEGAQLNVIGQEDGWSEVRLGDGREVFVASEFLEPAP